MKLGGTIVSAIIVAIILIIIWLLLDFTGGVYDEVTNQRLCRTATDTYLASHPELKLHCE